MSEGKDQETKIAELQAQLANIKDKYKLLSCNQNELNQKYSAKISKATDDRLESLNKWHDDELEAAERLHDGQLLGIENDVEKQKEDSKKHVFEVILLKQHLLAEKLPKAAKYFSQFKNPFIDACNEEDKQRAKKIKVDLQNTTILPQDEIRKLLEDCAVTKKIASAVDGELTVNGESFRVGSSCTIKLDEGIVFTGAIKNITKTQISFIPNGGSEMCFTVAAINIGLVGISK